jgi:hypothetical protein
MNFKGFLTKEKTMGKYINFKNISSKKVTLKAPVYFYMDRCNIMESLNIKKFEDDDNEFEVQVSTVYSGGFNVWFDSIEKAQKLYDFLVNMLINDIGGQIDLNDYR